MPDAPWSGPQAEDDLNEKEKSMRDALTEAADLLTDLKTAYEKLGYTVIDSPIRPGQPLYADAGTDYYKACSLTPDLCKEMKDWMTSNGWWLNLFIHKDRCSCVLHHETHTLVSKHPIGEASTEELAVLRAFLEVTKEKSE